MKLEYVIQMRRKKTPDAEDEFLYFTHRNNGPHFTKHVHQAYLMKSEDEANLNFGYILRWMEEVEKVYERQIFIRVRDDEEFHNYTEWAKRNGISNQLPTVVNWDPATACGFYDVVRSSLVTNPSVKEDE